MYIALYNENRNHITNVNHATYDATLRVYDNDSFTAEGVCAEDINDAKIAVLNDDVGNYKYACFSDVITPDANKRTIKGLDFMTLWDTEILLDYTPSGSFDGRLSAIFNKIKNLVFNGSDLTINKIPVEVTIPTDNTDTTTVYGSYQGTYQLVNAYTFLKCYLKYYEYNIESYYDVARGVIVFTFVKCTTALNVDLSDFIYELTTTSTATNKAVATIKFTPENEGDPRPSSIATIYYYRDADNNIVQSDEVGNIANRLYPVKAKWFESEYLADAQFNAVYELANARYVDNIIIDNNITLDPIDFSAYPLYTKVGLYYEGQLYKTLPISEKNTTFDGNGENTKIKLGFKKILLTEIIKK
jgi:hypothetical protein